MLKPLFPMGLVGLSVVAFTTSSWAVPLESVPNPRRSGGWVSDTANLLDANTQIQLNRLITDLETRTTSEIAVVTVTDTAPAANPKAFATSLFNAWKIGKKGKNNGVLFLVSRSDRRV
jgi:uncharacterized protein